LNNYIKNLTKFNFNMEEIRLFDSFAGLGALHQSLNELGVPVKLVGMSEIDVDAIISYSGVHNLELDKIDSLEDKEMRDYLIERNIGYDFVKGKSCIPRLKKDKLEKCYKASVLTNNLGDISRLNYVDIPDFDLFNMSFPCQSVSNAGKQEGFINEDGTTTRSGLYVYGIEVIKAKKPKYIMIENVKGLIQKKFVSHFTDMVNEIESLGYNCYYPKKENGQPTCLNAKNYGIPQNRERIFVICIRKDVDNGLFSFPQGFDNGLRLKDFLEDEVDEKYYLDKPWHFSTELDEKHDTNEIAQIEGIAYKATRSITDIDKICRCIDTMCGGQREPKIVCEQRCDEGLRFFKDNVCGSLRTINSGGDKRIIEVEDNNIGFRIRKLTPKECWRLMGFRDEHIERAIALGTSNSQLYKQAGNSIVVDVLYYIFKELFKEYIIE
jgi:DNA (cytosine-5)-methyltransferase 1